MFHLWYVFLTVGGGGVAHFVIREHVEGSVIKRRPVREVENVGLIFSQLNLWIAVARHKLN